jgi:hypothetical protein
MRQFGPYPWTQPPGESMDFSADRDFVCSANDLLAESLPEGVVKFKIDGGSSGYDKVE